jgi:hypothetical protein
VVLPPGQDVNDVHRAAGASSGDHLRRLIATAQWLGGAPRVSVLGLPVADVASAVVAPAAATALLSPLAGAPALAAPTPPGVAVRVDGDELHVDIATRRYRVRGLFSNRGADAMKINLRIMIERAGTDALFHVDTLDLYQTRFRQAFTVAAAAECGLHPDVIKAFLGKLLLTLECQLAEQQRRRSAAAAGSATGSTAAVDPVAKNLWPPYKLKTYGHPISDHNHLSSYEISLPQTPASRLGFNR